MSDYDEDFEENSISMSVQSEEENIPMPVKATSEDNDSNPLTVKLEEDNISIPVKATAENNDRNSIAAKSEEENIPMPVKATSEDNDSNPLAAKLEEENIHMSLKATSEDNDSNPLAAKLEEENIPMSLKATAEDNDSLPMPLKSGEENIPMSLKATAEDKDCIPMAVKSELFRLSSLLNLDHTEVKSERDCVNLIRDSIRKIERIQNGNGKKNARASGKKSTGDEDETARQEKIIAAKAKSIEDDVQITLKAFDDVGGLKAKIKQLQNKHRKEREQRNAFETFIESQNKKIMILITHVDKLMKALKRESSKTMKALEDKRQIEKQVGTLTNKIEKQAKVISVQNRYVAEIAEGSKILQDQLALMDENYLELRNRLDKSRKLFSTQMSKVQKESADLRVKYSMATHGKLLDAVPLPSHGDLTDYMVNINMEGFRGSMDTAELLHRTTGGGGGRKGRPRAASARAATSTSRSGLYNTMPSMNTMDTATSTMCMGGMPATSPPSSPKARNSLLLQRHTSGDSPILSDYPQDIGPAKEYAQQAFLKGIQHNHMIPVQKLTPHEAEIKEKHIMRKIHDKQKKSDMQGWSSEQLQELMKT